MDIFDKGRHCEFCGRSENEVGKLISAPSGVCICNDCVEICADLIYNDADAASLAGQFSTVASLSEHKMVTLSELGNVADMGPQWDAGAQWLFFMPWYDYGNDYTAGYAHAHADIGWWTQTFASDAVIDRSELPDDLF